MKIIRILTLLFLALAVRTPFASETIRLTNGEWQPYLSEHAPHYGFASHIIAEAFGLVGVEVEYGFFPWRRSFELAKKGATWDGTAVWLYSEERAASFYYTDSVIPSNTAFFHLNDVEFDWNTMEDLKDKRIGTTLEYSYGPEFDEADKSGIIDPERVATDELNLKKLLKGRIEVFPGEVMVTYTQIRETFSKEDAARFTHHPKSLHRNLQYLLLSKANPDNERFAELFNEGLKQLKESGRYDQIIADGLAGKYAKTK